MTTCNSCGGVIGRDCFNPSECAWIGEQQQRQQADDGYRLREELYHLRLENEKFRTAIQSAISYEGGRESEWGQRAEGAFAILHSSLV